ncbi:MAG: iron-containing alcohol dehydrogenase [Lachnospiraceae bacterium]
MVYDRTVANPTAANVEEALNLYLSNNCQAIIGFGGGSSMDCAKADRCPGRLPEKESRQNGRNPQSPP